MTKITSTTLALLLLAGTTSTAMAQEFSFGVDALNLTPSLSDGIGDNDDIGATPSVRAHADYTFSNGAGVRLQVWDLDASYDVGLNGSPSEIEFRQIDLMGFNRFEVTPGLTLELSAGLRQLEYRDQNFTENNNEASFDGIGAVVGLEAKQAIFDNGAIYGSFEAASLFGDASDGNDDDQQANRAQTAIGLGYEHAFEIGAVNATIKAGYEIHNWDAFDDDADGALGFDGFVLGSTITF